MSFLSRYAATLLGGVLVLLLVLPLASCSRPGGADGDDGPRRGAEKEDDEEKKEEERPPVEVASLNRGSIEAMLRFSTNLEAEDSVQVFSEAARQVLDLRVEEGDRVRKGQVLIRLQDEEQQSTLERVTIELDKANREYDRQQNLYNKDLISEQAYNDATYEVERLTLELGDAKRQLSYTNVTAPIAGTITERMVNLGDYVTVNQPLFQLVDFDSIVARIFVPEKELGRLRVGQTARVFSDSLGGEARAGKVLRIAPVVDPRSGTIKVTVAIPSNQGLKPGMYVEVELVTATYDDVMLIPKRAVIYDDNLPYLFRVVEGDEMSEVERVVLDIELEDADHVMLAEGSEIAGRDRVVIAGQAGIKDGAEVRVIGDPPRVAADRADDASDSDDASSNDAVTEGEETIADIGDSAEDESSGDEAESP
ncbi:MAG: efflux RND transporter periplasmic adaptor subunit [Acidobacteriota bacterium]